MMNATEQKMKANPMFNTYPGTLSEEFADELLAQYDAAFGKVDDAEVRETIQFFLFLTGKGQ